MRIEIDKHEKITWDSLQFSPHNTIPDAVSCCVTLPNGEVCSVVGGGAGSGLYGDGETSFELLSFITDLTDEGVMGWLNKSQVIEHLKEVGNL